MFIAKISCYTTKPLTHAEYVFKGVLKEKATDHYLSLKTKKLTTA